MFRNAFESACQYSGGGHENGPKSLCSDSNAASEATHQTHEKEVTHTGSLVARRHALTKSYRIKRL